MKFQTACSFGNRDPFSWAFSFGESGAAIELIRVIAHQPRLILLTVDHCRGLLTTVTTCAIQYKTNFPATLGGMACVRTGEGGRERGSARMCVNVFAHATV